jgi:magnesium-transporting ATPase (P-type)
LQHPLLSQDFENNVSLEEIVPGDIILLKAGDVIPGDSLLMESKAPGVEYRKLKKIWGKSLWTLMRYSLMM